MASTIAQAPPVPPAAPAGRGARRRHFGGTPYLLLLPAIALVIVLFAYPLTLLILQSVSQPTWSLRNYTSAFTDSLMLRIIGNTFVIALETTLTALVLGYPVAYFIASPRRKDPKLLLFLVMFPFWCSLLVRIYAWMVILGRGGVVNNGIHDLFGQGATLDLMNNRFAVVVGMSQYMLPFMIMSLYSVMARFDHRLLEASSTMGGSTWRSFRKVYFPLNLPGVYAGCLLVFILSLGFYVTPALLGGPRDTTIAVYIQQQVQLLNWGPATAMATVLLVTVLILATIYNRVIGIESLATGGEAGGRR